MDPDQLVSPAIEISGVHSLTLQPSTSRGFAATPIYTPGSDVGSSVSGTPREYRPRRTENRAAIGRQLFSETPELPHQPGKKKTSKT